jgi:protein SCO1
MKILIKVLCVFVFLINTEVAFANMPTGHAGQNNETNIKEHLGAKLPVNLKFKDENGNPVALKDIFTKSTVLAFVYYHCPGVCTPLMNEMVNVVNKTDLTPGKDFDIVTISIDQNETPADAKQKKEDMMKIMRPDFPHSAWLFLTGDSASIVAATKIAGFNFERTGNTFIHTAALIFVSNDGKICRYLYPSYLPSGEFSILPFDFKMANIETSNGTLMPTVGKVLQFCFSYDPHGKTYVVNILQVSGALTLLGALIFVLIITLKPKKVKSNTR